MTVHVFGAFGAGESIVIEGSTETATSPIGAIIRHDLRGGAKTLVFTAAGMPLCLEAPVGMRPRVNAGTGRRR